MTVLLDNRPFRPSCWLSQDGRPKEQELEPAAHWFLFQLTLSGYLRTLGEPLAKFRKTFPENDFPTRQMLRSLVAGCLIDSCGYVGHPHLDLDISVLSGGLFGKTWDGLIVRFVDCHPKVNRPFLQLTLIWQPDVEYFSHEPELL